MTYTFNTIVEFIKNVFDTTDKADKSEKKAIIAVSGGIDSAVCLHLLYHTLGRERVIAVLLPYGDQDMSDASRECESMGVTPVVIDIKPAVDLLSRGDDPLRLGNIMARVRMIYQYDLAKEHNALVCGTENLSEYYLGYFTLFGDQACDFSPIAHLTKTEVRRLANEIKVGMSIQTKAPSAGLWDGQTDEQELGFTYDEADLHIRHEVHSSRVADRISRTHFKREIPYKLA